jgi:tripartite-type tricarboxylate transporter receptor subunit TctC
MTRLGNRPGIGIVAAALLLAACGQTAAPTESPRGEGSPEPEPEPTPAAAFEDGDTITVVVPYAAGGGYDTTTRLLAPCVEDALDEAADVAVVVQNITGASGQVGVGEAYAAEPDGLTLLMNAIDIMVPQQVVEGAEFDVSEFTPLAQFVQSGRAMMVRADVIPEGGDFADLIERSEESPILIGGAGLQGQIALMQLLLEDGGMPMELSLVEFEGTGEGIASMLRGELEAYLVGSASAIDAVETNPDDIVIAAVFNDDDPLLDELNAPTLSDAGILNAEEIGAVSGSNTRAFFGPPGMDQATADALTAAFESAMANPDCADAVEQAGDLVVFGGPDEVSRVISVITDVYTTYADELR